MVDLTDLDEMIKRNAEGLLYHKSCYFCGCGSILSSLEHLSDHLGK